MTATQKQGLRFVLETPVLQAAPPLQMDLMEVSIATMEVLQEGSGPVMGLLATATVKQVSTTLMAARHAQKATVGTSALLIPAKQLHPLQMMGPMVTSTASTGGASAGLQAPAPAHVVTPVLKALTAQHLNKSLTQVGSPTLPIIE
jgi:hypothetical protein